MNPWPSTITLSPGFLLGWGYQGNFIAVYIALAWAVSQHIDFSQNTKAWDVSQHIGTSKNIKAGAVSHHTDTSKSTKAWAVTTR